MKKKINIGDGDKDAEANSFGYEKTKGVPEFWLQIFKQVDTLSKMLQETDEPIIKHLEDIKVKCSDPSKPMSFELEFFFTENKFFTNRSHIKKLYHES